ncbi:MAG TPA: hypothetical protein VHD90_11685 [Phototrophicaceae bacterium]|nr:hypothetical protein [Phototrophicaceae bacterium]
MRKKLLFFAGLLGLLLLSACGGSSGPVKITSITLARDDGSGSPGQTVTDFKPTDHTFYATVTLDHLETGLKVKLTWVAVDAGGETNKEIDSSEFSALVANTINGKLSLPNDWPTGKYRLDVYLNDALAQSQSFNVVSS